MKSGRGWWRRRAGAGILILFSAVLIGLNLLAGRSPVKMGVLAALQPLLALLGEVDPPTLSSGEETPAPPEMADLRAKNDRLTYEVLRLREQLATTSAASFDAKRYPFQPLPAQVLCRAGVPGLRCVVVVDRGRVDGVQKGLGVVAGDRVVGRVFRVGEEISLVTLITDPACKVRCTLLPPASEKAPHGGDPAPSFEGLSEGDPDRQSGIALRHIPHHAGCEAGDAVVTTGYAGIFPGGMSVGRVISARKGSQSLFLDISVSPAVSGEALRSVLILLPAPVPGLGADVAGRSAGR
ncbi:MAG: rod shape-determining protein MreC [Planctomycetota bacterium]|jgi:rod shape-determining protein MreC